MMSRYRAEHLFVTGNELRTQHIVNFDGCEKVHRHKIVTEGLQSGICFYGHADNGI